MSILSTNDPPSLFLYGVAADELRQREIERIKAATIPTLAGLRAFSPDELRREVAGMLERLGYIHHSTGDTGNLTIGKDGRTLVVACAKSPEPIRRQAIARLHEAIMHTAAAAGFYVTARHFEPDAITYAASLPITLVDGDKLVASMCRSKAGIEPPDAYKAMCKICGAVVEHRLTQAEALPCGSGHVVAPTIARAAIFPEGAKPAAIGAQASPAPRQRRGRRMTAKAHNKRLRLTHARRAPRAASALRITDLVRMPALGVRSAVGLLPYMSGRSKEPSARSWPLSPPVVARNKQINL